MSAAAQVLVVLAVAGCSSAAEEFLGPRGDVATSRPAPPPRSWLEAARLAEEKVSWEEAGYALDRWAAFHEVDEGWYRRRLRAAERCGDFERCSELRAEMVARYPHDEGMVIDFADDLQQIGRGEEAIAVLQNAQTAGSSATQQALAEVLRREGRYREAAVVLEEAAADQEEPVRSHLLLEASALYEQSGDLAASLRAIEGTLDPEGLRVEEQRTLSRIRVFETGEPGNVADAVDLMRHHPEADFRLKGVTYLARGSFPDDVLIFAEGLGDPDPRVVRVSAREFARRAGPAAADRVALLVEHEDEALRIEALGLLGEIGGESHLPILLVGLDPEDRGGFRAARRSLESISGHQIGVELDPDLERRREIADAWRVWWEARSRSSTP